VTEELKLYDGCYVKTDSGLIMGPVDAASYFSIGEMCWSDNGGVAWNAKTDTVADGCRVIAIYPSLAAAAAANPEM